MPYPPPTVAAQRQPFENPLRQLVARPLVAKQRNVQVLLKQKSVGVLNVPKPFRPRRRNHARQPLLRQLRHAPRPSDLQPHQPPLLVRQPPRNGPRKPLRLVVAERHLQPVPKRPVRPPAVGAPLLLPLPPARVLNRRFSESSARSKRSSYPYGSAYPFRSARRNEVSRTNSRTIRSPKNHSPVCSNRSINPTYPTGNLFTFPTYPQTAKVRRNPRYA